MLTPAGVLVKKLHGLEAMRVIGWDLGHCKGKSLFESQDVTSDLLRNMAGNVWSAFTFIPLAIASFGAVPDHLNHATRPKSQTEPNVAVDLGSDSGSCASAPSEVGAMAGKFAAGFTAVGDEAV